MPHSDGRISPDCSMTKLPWTASRCGTETDSGTGSFLHRQQSYDWTDMDAALDLLPRDCPCKVASPGFPPSSRCSDNNWRLVTR